MAITMQVELKGLKKMWVRVNIYPCVDRISARQNRSFSPAVQPALREMSCQLLFLLLTIGACLPPAEGQAAYDELPDLYKKGVDLALKQLNSHSGIQHYLFFLKSLTKSEAQSGFGVNYIYHNFYLKPTKCSKDTVDPDPKKCPFRNDRPLIDCAVCYKTYSGIVENEPTPFVNCVHKPALTEDMTAKRVEHCNNMAYSSGAVTLLGSIGKN
ncbi:hypothetical protein SKAU_G00381340 [Synaphobranchus kaupii]|uniref:Retinoic acid receptor responder protein 2 n=1 Tax=Synaphobranchus kaupii TaxID=118154 RepID=A0A9Q1IEQ6_SYNKA|nr:hypothetical protein SKAU_G00381340 [Synaphobranchus kaupii]